MTKNLPSETNYQLYLARLLLQSLEREINSQTLSERLLLDAWGEGVVLHLHRCITKFWQELIDQHRVFDLPSFDNALEYMDSDSWPADFREIRHLANNGWLSALLSAQPTGGVMQALPTHSDVIQVTSLADASYSLRDLQQWYRACDELIDRLRGSGQEW